MREMQIQRDVSVLALRLSLHRISCCRKIADQQHLALGARDGCVQQRAIKKPVLCDWNDRPSPLGSLSLVGRDRVP